MSTYLNLNSLIAWGAWDVDGALWGICPAGHGAADDADAQRQARPIHIDVHPSFFTKELVFCFYLSPFKSDF